MRNRYVFLLDLLLVAGSALGAFALRFEWVFFSTRPEYRAYLVAALILKPALYVLFGLYRRYWRYTSVFDIGLITAAVTAASAAMTLFVIFGFWFGLIEQFPRTVLIIDWLLSLLTVGGLRLSIRLVTDAATRARGPVTRATRRVLVVGAGEAGTLVVREMRRNPQLGLLPVGFIDDDPTKRGKRILGLPVAGALEDLEDTARHMLVEEVVIAIPTAPGSLLRRVAQAARHLNLKTRTVPGLYEFLDEQVSVSRLREVDITDLLRRQPVTASEHTTTYLHGQVVLVTGAGGSIGSELCRQVAMAGPARLVILGHGENSVFDVEGRLRASFPGLDLVSVIADIRDAVRIDAVLGVYRPSVVFHAAAHKHVALMEQNPGEAVTNNIIGTRNVVDACERHGADRFVLVSTDKAVSPTSVMGASKRVAETIVRLRARASSREFVIVRFGNVLGSRGSVVGIFKTQIEAGGPITITHPDMQRFFMTIPEAVHLVIQAGGQGGCGDLFVLNMGRPVRITDLAQDLISLSGAQADDVRIVYTGMRPGEKLVEALFEADARVEPTSHRDIMRVIEPDTIDTARLDERLSAMAAVRPDRPADVRRMLADMLPTLQPTDAVVSFSPPVAPQ